MLLVDTHLHLYSDEYGVEQPALLLNASQKGVQQFLLPNIDTESIQGIKKLVQEYPQICYGMMGLHPCYVKEDYKIQLNVIKKELYNEKYFAVGEIGLDLYWDKSTFEIQKIAFIEQCNWAIELNLPIAIHCRESLDETIEIVKDIQNKNENKLIGVFHCFSGDIEQALKVIDLGFYLGVGGVLTFKNSGLAQVIEKIDLSKIVLETDGPYLAPVPHRGKRNEPEYITLVAEKLALIKNVSTELVANITTQNAKELFKIN